jgi:nucleotide-binding universal stress UspA family protein
MGLERIVVGVDGSACASAAVEWAAMLAGLSGAEVLAVHALGMLEQMPDGERVAAEPRRDEIRDALESTWTAPLAAAGVTYRAELRDGDAVSVLLAAGDEVDADVLVVGSRGMGGYPELLLGSTSTQVAQRGSRPVVIIPAAGSPT